MRITASRRIAVVAAVAVLGLAGCTSDDDGAAPTGAGSSAVEASGPADAASSGSTAADGATGAPDGSDAAADPSAGSGQGSSAGSGQAESGGDSSGAAGTALPSPTSIAPSSRSPKPTPSTPKPSGSGVVDEFGQNDLAFFGAMCSALIDKPASKLPDLESQELPARREAAAALFTDHADRLDAAVVAMQQAGAPNVTDGDKLAESVLAAYPKEAAVARQGATEIEAAGDDAAYQRAVDQTRDAMNTAAEDLTAFDTMLAAPAMIRQLQRVPECAELVGGA